MINLEEIAARIKAVPLHEGRRIIAIAGAPASGKSTLATALAEHLPNACVVPMDGFHRDNADLENSGLLDRKGAPETFDVAGFIDIILRIRASGDVSFPTFDRGTDCVIPDGGRLGASDQTVLVEGNYLLLKTAPWNRLMREWDFRIMIDVPLPVLQDRLVQRWLDNGHDARGALARAQQNDLPNARLVISESAVADHTLQLR